MSAGDARLDGGRTIGVVAEWFSIEVFNRESSARAWREAHGDPLIVVATGYGATDWEWHDLEWGVVLEVEVPDEATWDAFTGDPTVRAALDAVPDPVSGLLLYRGRGGSSGARWPRHPRPAAGAGAMSLPEPFDDIQPQADDEPIALALVR